LTHGIMAPGVRTHGMQHGRIAQNNMRMLGDMPTPLAVTWRTCRRNGTPSLCRLRCSATRTCRSARQPPRRLGTTEYSFGTVPLGRCPRLFMRPKCFSSTVEYPESCDRQHAAPSTGCAAQLPSSCGGHEGRAGVPSPHPPGPARSSPGVPLAASLLSHTRRHAHSHSHAHFNSNAAHGCISQSPLAFP
jgi:hypothetical protein